jgi:CRP/FNR family transcriptional regulator, cyclic AMP receptor protein
MHANLAAGKLRAADMARQGFDPQRFLETVGVGRTVSEYRKDAVIFSQGDAAKGIFYILKGKVKIAVISGRGKEAVIGILDRGSFFGEGCLIAQTVRLSSAAAIVDSTILRIEKTQMMRVLQTEPKFGEFVVKCLLGRNSRIEDDLVDQLLNASEKRLARALLLLANFGNENGPQPITAKINQEILAEMVGTTRPRVSFFLNKFRKLGFIDYNGSLQVHSSLLTVVLRD